jgi:dipeptidyl aminopeptidase/acylaminoacyl peptidase
LNYEFQDLFKRRDSMKGKFFVFGLAVLLIMGVSVSAQEPYKLPPKEVIDIVTAPPPPRTSISPTGEDMMLIEYESMPSIAYMAQPLLRIAGTRITPNNNSRQVTIFYTGIKIKNIKTGEIIKVDLPDNAKLGYPGWSFDGKWIAFARYLDNGVELWAADRKTGKARALTGPVVNATTTSGFSWMPDNQHLLVQTILKDRGNPPKKPSVPKGPNIQVASGKQAKVWTYQDLLKDPYDEELFDYYMTSQLVKINASTGETTKLGKPGIYFYPDPSPDGNFILIHKIDKPYSYSVPYFYFTHTLDIWDTDGKLVHHLADLPLADDVPMRGVTKGIRSIQWRALKPATLVWVEALDEGNPENKVPFRDKVMTLSAPFKDKPKRITNIEHRYSGLSWMKTAGKALLTEYDWKRRWRTTYLIDVDKPSIPRKKMIDISSQDRYNNPGSPVFTITSSGEYIIIQDKDWIYLSGSGASPKGDYPFLDRMNLKTEKKERLFHCQEDTYERFVDFVGSSRDQIITSFESKSQPPNYYLYSLKTKKRAPLTDYKDPAPQMTGMKKQLIKYERDDGVPLSGTLYLPPDYKEGERLPLVMWAYPIEYSSAQTAGQIRGSANRFTFFRGTSQLFYVTQGYAVLDRAEMPIIGDPKTMNDTFVEQIVAAAKAGIDKLNSMGIIDPKRVGVGGHSYGAFMTANLLAHCDLFATGVARSGAYNRTLTPFGFQSERRTLWEAPEIYFKVSPFMHADKINEPILLIHGEIDNNSGTFPIQSRRLFHALKGFGTMVRLVFLPHESHGYRAKESVLHVLAEMIEWFDKYVKNKK